VIERALEGAAVVVDALFGVGLARPLASPYVEWIERVNAADAIRVAADVPSGLSGDDGVPLPVAVRAHVTAAMGFVKRGTTTASGAPYAGRVVEVDVGLPGSVHRLRLA
jgi:NAD(P)H-hydrate epimerase